MRASVKKGRKWELELLERLRSIYGPHVERTPYTQSCDFKNTADVRIEAKAWDQPRFRGWIHAMRRVATTPKWCILWCGDRRKGLDRPVAMLDLEYMLYLLNCEQNLVNLGGIVTAKVSSDEGGVEDGGSGDVPEVLQGASV